MITLPGEAKRLWIFLDEHGESSAVMCAHHADEHDWNVGDGATASHCDQDIDCEGCAAEMGWDS